MSNYQEVPMNKAAEKSPSREEETRFLLIDGTSVSPKEAVEAGKKACRILQVIASIVILLGILLGIRFAIDLSAFPTGWAIALTVEGVLLGFAALLLVLSVRLDPEQYGVSVLNLGRRRNAKKSAPSSLENGIAADNVLELHSALGNALYANLGEKRWQYRLKGKLSKPLAAIDLASCEILKDGLKFQPERPEPTTPSGNTGNFGILLRFTASAKPSLELACHSKQVALECRDVLDNLLK